MHHQSDPWDCRAALHVCSASVPVKLRNGSHVSRGVPSSPEILQVSQLGTGRTLCSGGTYSKSWIGRAMGCWMHTSSARQSSGLKAIPKCFSANRPGFVCTYGAIGGKYLSYPPCVYTILYTAALLSFTCRLPSSFTCSLPPAPAIEGPRDDSSSHCIEMQRSEKVQYCYDTKKIQYDTIEGDSSTDGCPLPSSNIVSIRCAVLSFSPWIGQRRMAHRSEMRCT